MTPQARRRLWTCAGLLAWLIVAVAVSRTALSGIVRPGQLVSPATPAGQLHLVDFRDTVWGPARDLLSGHDPYDTAGYLARHPGAQEFDLDAPWQLAGGLPFALLPYGMAAVLWVLLQPLLALASTVLLLRSTGWPLARSVSVGAALAAAALATLPGRVSVTGGQTTWVIVAGAALVVHGLLRRPWLAGLGLALMTTKPQFGLPVALLLLAGLRAWAPVWRGAVVATVTGVVPLGFVLADAGSPAALVRVLRANADYAARFQPLTRLESPQQTRIDASGVLARVAGAPPALVQLLVAAAILGLAAAVLRLRRGPGLADSWAATTLCTATLLCIVHQGYDLTLLVVPVAVAVPSLASLARLPRPWLDLLPVAAVTAALVHPRRFDAVLTGHPVSLGASQAVDGALLAGALLAAAGLAAARSSAQPRPE